MPLSDGYSNLLSEFNREANAEFYGWVRAQFEAQRERKRLTVVIDRPPILPKWLYDLMQEMDDG